MGPAAESPQADGTDALEAGPAAAPAPGPVAAPAPGPRAVKGKSQASTAHNITHAMSPSGGVQTVSDHVFFIYQSPGLIFSIFVLTKWRR